MIRPFGFRDTLAIRKLQSNAQRLDWPEGLIATRSPLRMMLLARLTQLNLGAPAFVWPGTDGHGRVSGFVQVLQQRERPEWDIIALGPAWDGSNGVQRVWTHLLDRLSQRAGESGILRLYARIAEDSLEEDVLRACDFSPYASQMVLASRGAASEGWPKPGGEPRPRQPRDEWALHQLYTRATPSAVQVAEGKASLEGYALNLGLLGMGEEYVYENQGAIRGYLSIASGPAGRAWRLLSDPQDMEGGLALLAWGLARLQSDPAAPTYGLIRGYEQEVAGWLLDHGYEPAGQHKLMVRQLAVRVKEPLLKLSPALEQRMKPAHTQSFEGTR